MVHANGVVAKARIEAYETYLAKMGSVEPIVTGIFLMVGRRIVGEPMFPRDASPGVAGFSYPIESSLLELCELHRVKAGPVKRAEARRGPVVAEAIGAFDSVEPGVGFDGGSMGAGFVVPGARVAPGGLRGAMVG